MSIAAAGPADYGQMASLISDSASIKQKLDQLTTQISTGLVSNTYAGLGSGAAVSLNLNPQIAALQTWQNNINQPPAAMQVTQTAMTQIQQIAVQLPRRRPATWKAPTPRKWTASPPRRNRRWCRSPDLLDTQDGNTYVFAGQDSSKSAGARSGL